MVTKPNSLPSRGTGTFMPHKPPIVVGIAKIMVTEARNFITKFRLLLMIEANTSIMLLRIWLYNSLLIFNDDVFQKVFVFFVELDQMS